METSMYKKRACLGLTGTQTKPQGATSTNTNKGATRATTITGLEACFWQKGQQVVQGGNPGPKA